MPSSAKSLGLFRSGVNVAFSQNMTGAYLLLPAKAGHFIQLVSAELYVDAAQVITFRSGDTDAIIGGLHKQGGRINISLGEAWAHNIRTRVGEAFYLHLENNVEVTGPIQGRYVRG